MSNDDPYQRGFTCGEVRRADSEYDARYDFADAAKAGVYHEFKRGFDDGFAGKDPQP